MSGPVVLVGLYERAVEGYRVHVRYSAGSWYSPFGRVCFSGFVVYYMETSSM